MTQKRVHMPAERMVNGHDESVGAVSVSGISIVENNPDYKEASGNSTASKDFTREVQDEKSRVQDLEVNKFETNNRSQLHDMSSAKLQNTNDPLPNTPAPTKTNDATKGEPEDQQKTLTYMIYFFLGAITLFAVIWWIVFFVEIAEVEVIKKEDHSGADEEVNAISCPSEWLVGSPDNTQCIFKCTPTADVLQPSSPSSDKLGYWSKETSSCVSCSNEWEQIVDGETDGVKFCERKCPAESGK